MESAWKAECHLTKLNTYNPRYGQAYDEFVMAKSSSSDYNNYFRAKLQYYNALALAHNLQNFGIYERTESWANAFVDFLDPQYSPHGVISQMHALSLMIIGGQKRFTSKQKTAELVFESMKACVRDSAFMTGKPSNLLHHLTFV